MHGMHAPPAKGLGPRRALAAAWLVCGTLGVVRADGPAGVPPGGDGRLVRLSLWPTETRLAGAGRLQQVLVTAHDANGGVRDVSRSAKFRVVDPAVARIAPDGLLAALANGTTELIAEHDGRSVRVPVIVSATERAQPTSFVDEVVPLFGRLGCNAGACHGKASGQNGFKLSLLGFDPRADFDALVREARGRRVFPSDPSRSLLVQKATGRVPHGGGVRIRPGSRDEALVVRWIGQGLRFGAPDDPRVVSISVHPAHRLVGTDSQQQLAVTAAYDDGSTRDVTADSEFHTTDTEVVELEEGGLVRTRKMPGEGAVMARFLGHIAVFRATVPRGAKPASTVRHDPANFVDRHVFAKLDQLRIAPAPLASDGEFLRRVSLDVAGTLPTAEEVAQFVADPAPDKRAKAIDALLARPEHVSYFALKWGDILRNRRDGLVKVGGFSGRTLAMHAWIRKSLEENKPYDRFVRELLTAKGTMYGEGDQGHAAVGWYNVVQTPQAMTDDLAQVFLGTRIQCAQCHHHPYEKWSQDDYWGLAAFFARLKLETPKDVPKDFRMGQQVVLLAEGSLKGPHGKSYARPRVLDGDELDVPAADDPRAALADWLARPDNPFFAKALVNRYWAHFLGRGLVDPPDDMRVTNPPSHPELLDELARDFVASGFDLRHVVRTICNSRTYQLAATPDESNAKSRGTFARFAPRRLPAEVLLDAVDRVTESPTPYAGTLPVSRAIELPDENIPLRGGYDSKFLEVFGRPKRDSACECERVAAASLSQGLYLVGSTEMHRKLKDQKARARRYAAEERPTSEKLRELWLSSFARQPSAEELRTAEEFLDAEFARAAAETSTNAQLLLRQQAWEDLIWSAINTKEFLFNH